MKIAFIIRLWHNDPAEMQWRMYYFEGAVLPRIKAQHTDHDFDICVLCPPSVHNKMRALGIKPFTLNTPDFNYKKQGNFTYDQTIGLDRYDIQIRIDSDDLIAPYFLHTILDTPTDYVTFQPELYLLKTGKITPMKHQYRTDQPSAFLAVKNYPECIYHKVFLRFNDRKCTLYPKGMAWVTIHDRNTGTKATS